MKSLFDKVRGWSRRFAVAAAVGQRPELGLQHPGALVDEAQQVAVDVADVERHGFAAAAQRDAAVGVGEQQKRSPGGIGGIARFEFGCEDVEGP